MKLPKIGKRDKKKDDGDLPVAGPDLDEDLLKEVVEKKGKGKKKRLTKKKEPGDEDVVYDWMTGEEVGIVRNVITNQQGAVISYEVKSLAGNIIQYSVTQIDATDEGYILLPIWLSKAREYRDRLSDASRKLTELKTMLENNTISLETYAEMAKVTFSVDLLENCDRSIEEVEKRLLELNSEKGKIEQEIYSLDIKRRVGLIERVDYSQASLDLTDTYKRILYHMAETETLQKELVDTFREARKMEEIPGVRPPRERKYKLHFTLSSNPLLNVQVKKIED